MRKLFIILSLISFELGFAQDLTGAWRWEGVDESGRPMTAVAIVADRFFSDAWFDSETGAFIRTKGGSWQLDGDELTETVEYDTQNPEGVGNSNTATISYSEEEVVFVESGKVWTRIDNGDPGKLNGAWLITGRKRGDEMGEIDPNRPRKTMKILSGTRFQWIAYNTETKQFMGTGGGTYTTEDGKYIENIEFFSRDDSRVGASLEFNFELKDGKWHHSGYSSRGDPIYEIWSNREQ